MCSYLHEIKKSKFYAYIKSVDSVYDAKCFVDELKKDNKKCTHICFAYSINSPDGFFEKCIDDGEPGGTAGKPILNVIQKNNLKNVCIAVVRYFGGIKLGAGGLCRAYSKSASEVCKLFLEK